MGSGGTFPVLLTIGQAADRLNASRATIYRLLDAGELRRIKSRARTRIDEADLLAFVERCRQEVS